MADLRKFFASEGAKVDFRRAVPLLQGLHVLFSRKMGLLVRETEHTLKSMSNPIDVVKIEGEDADAEPKATKRRAAANAAREGATRYQANAALQLNPNNFDWFLSGIDQTRLQGILARGSKNPQAGVDFGMNNLFKTEDTFLMVRDPVVGAADPLNDLSFSLGGKPAGQGDAPMEGSAFRNLPDEAAGFEGALRDFEQPMFDADADMLHNENLL